MPPTLTRFLRGPLDGLLMPLNEAPDLIGFEQGCAGYTAVYVAVWDEPRAPEFPEVALRIYRFDRYESNAPPPYTTSRPV